MRYRYLVILLPALVALALALWAYLVRDSGVSRTAGALIELAGLVLVILGTCLVWLVRLGRGLRGVLLTLIGIGLVGCLVAAWFLMQTWLTAAVAVALVGWLFAVFAPVPARVVA